MKGIKHDLKLRYGPSWTTHGTLDEGTLYREEIESKWGAMDTCDNGIVH
jgi:hypothetical protein